MRLTESELLGAVDALSSGQLRVWIRQGWVKPEVDDGERRYSEVDVARVRLVCHLRHEVKLSNDAVAVVLSLTDQLYGLRRELRHLAQAVDAEPDEVRARIRAKLHRQESG